MRMQPNKKTIGAFILAGVSAFVIIVAVALGVGLHRGPKNLYVMYFHESIKGLSIGAPVVLSGVEVGKVVKIEIVPDAENHGFEIPVFVTFKDIEKTISVFPNRHDLDEEEIITALIDKGLHAKLINQNLLTGQLMIELDMKPAKTTMTRGEFDGIYEIPTTLSSITELSESVQNIPFKEVVENLNQTLTELKDVISPAAKISNELSKKSAVTLNNFNQAVQDVSRAANSLRNLADYLEQHPESLIRGK